MTLNDSEIMAGIEMVSVSFHSSVTLMMPSRHIVDFGSRKSTANTPTSRNPLCGKFTSNFGNAHFELTH